MPSECAPSVPLQSSRSCPEDAAASHTSSAAPAKPFMPFRRHECAAICPYSFHVLCALFEGAPADAHSIATSTLHVPCSKEVDQLLRPKRGNLKSLYTGKCCLHSIFTPLLFLCVYLLPPSSPLHQQHSPHSSTHTNKTAHPHKTSLSSASKSQARLFTSSIHLIPVPKLKSCTPLISLLSASNPLFPYRLPPTFISLSSASDPQAHHCASSIHRIPVPTLSKLHTHTILSFSRQNLPLHTSVPAASTSFQCLCLKRWKSAS
eukprot:1161145-Pelagomonas_calceolata.AAC.4